MNLTELALIMAASISPAATAYAATSPQPTVSQPAKAKVEYSSLREDVESIRDAVFKQGAETKNTEAYNLLINSVREGDDTLQAKLQNDGKDITATVIRTKDKGSNVHTVLGFGVLVKYADGKTISANVASSALKSKDLIYGQSRSGKVFGIHIDGRLIQTASTGDEAVYVSDEALEDTVKTVKEISDLANSLRTRYH